jgi:hypothetical protein
MKTCMAVLTGLALATMAHPALARRAPVYTAGVSVQAISGTGCLDQNGTSFAGVMQYSGVSGAAATLRTVLPQLGAVSTQILEITGGLGTTHPTGTFALSRVNSAGTTSNAEGTFNGTVIVADRNSFIFVLTENYGSCNEGMFISATRVKPQ